MKPDEEIPDLGGESELLESGSINSPWGQIGVRIYRTIPRTHLGGNQQSSGPSVSRFYQSPPEEFDRLLSITRLRMRRDLARRSERKADFRDSRSQETTLCQ